jgi:hypothetical protein
MAETHPSPDQSSLAGCLEKVRQMETAEPRAMNYEPGNDSHFFAPCSSFKVQLLLDHFAYVRLME